MNRRTFVKNTLVTSTGLLILSHSSFNDASSADEPEQNFFNPPSSAKPVVYWMWMNGHITKEGITLDLEIMKHIGMGGAFIYDTGTGIPKGPVNYSSEEWQEMLLYAMSEARRLGLELLIHNAPGYSSTAGPWVTPEMSMQQFVWSETRAKSDGSIDVQLPQPYTKLNYYKDAFVVAFPSVAGETVLMKDRVVHVYLNSNEIDKTVLLDNNLETKVRLEAPYILDFEFAEPFEARAITLTRVVERVKVIYDDIYDQPPTFVLECSNDRIHYQTVCTINMPLVRFMVAPGVQSFDAVSAKYFRLTTTTPTWLAGVELHTAPRLADWPGKTNFADTEIKPDEQIVAPEFIIDSTTIVDLSDKLSPDGRLKWNAPAGNWTILRMGHTCIGATNASSPDSGVGLEIDKLSSDAVDFYFENFLNGVITRLRSFIPKTFKGILIDSYEVGKQNWTQQFPSAFKQKRSYDIMSWLPALTGRIVQNIEDTEKFLWDIRRTHADLMAGNYYGHFQQRCHQAGLQFYNEPYGDGVFDGLQAAQHLDVVMAEFWAHYVPGTMSIVDQAVSAAHGNGKKLVAVEAFTGMPLTSRWTEYPYALKTQGDHIYSRGVNQFGFHVFVHQPYPTGFPGMTMGPYGTHFDRNTTWIKQAGAWIKYLTRTQYLLQQGIYVADICYFKGENPVAKHGVPDVNHADPPTPINLAGDVISPDVLMNRIKIKKGKIILPDGMQYSLMILAPLKNISPEILRKLKALVAQGLVLIVSSKPNDTPGLIPQPEAKATISKLTEELWRDLDGVQVKECSFGKGKIYWNKPFDEVLKAHNVAPDFEFTAKNQDAVVHYTHRRIGDTDLYFISNQLRRQESIVGNFRVTEKTPEFWNAEDGELFQTPIYEFVEERTYVPIDLKPAGSVFVVFRNKSNRPFYQSISKNDSTLVSTKPHLIVNQHLYQNVANNFTLTLWIKPDTYAFPGKGILIFPAEGEAEYGPNHACFGLRAGQNGVTVFERAKGPNRDAKPVIASTQPLQGWTHVAVQYENGKPALFLNGELVATNEGSGKIIHPGLQTPPTDELFSAVFEGNSTEPELYDEVLANGSIYALYQKGLPPPELPTPITVKRTRQGALHATVWENGIYRFKNTHETKSLEVSGCEIAMLGNPWQVSFPKSAGAPKEIQLEKLISLHRHSDFSVRHFSGTASYFTFFQFSSKNLTKEKRILLDLGRVEVIAEVKLNGKPLGVLWKEPYRVEVTKALVHGTNHLEVLVTTLWPNRMIGDEYFPKENNYDEDGLITKLPDWYLHNQPKPGQRITFSAWNTFKKTDPLLESGLLGPVRLITGVEKIIV